MPSSPKVASYSLRARQSHVELERDAHKGKSLNSAFTTPRQVSNSGDWILVSMLIVLASCVRLYKLDHPNSVVFDEVHFGGFAGKYIKTKFFMDVHPPLAKLLITLAAWLGRYRGNFDFKDIGKEYVDVPYVTMRAMPALLGIGVIPLAYLTLKALHCNTVSALLGALLVTFENALITQSRLILLDSPLVFFTALTVYCWCQFANQSGKSKADFSKTWWIWLASTGISLGMVVSCKWVGLFSIATIGLAVIRQLWVLLGDTRVPMTQLLRHVLARAICLILVPILVYMFMFEIHFKILNTSGDGDAFMSSEFQHTLAGHGMADTFADVSLGSTVEIKHLATQGGYLHSHPHTYPGGSNQQQITLYPHRDDNNKWLITNASAENPEDSKYDYLTMPLVHIEDQQIIRLEHVATEKRLHSHDVKAPVSDVDFQFEVSGYGFPGFDGDANDNWRVEIEYGDRRDLHSSTRLRALRTKFRLRHVLRGCYLFSHKVKLPAWGFEQQEVTCNNNPNRENSVWYIETNTHPVLPATADKVNYRKPGFLSKFLELNQVMWRTNAGLTERHAYDSRPQSWPTLKRGINFWVKDHQQVYLLGNPLTWFMALLSLGAYFGVRGLIILRAKRGYKDLNNSVVAFYDDLCTFLVMGWALHYLPFFLMQRQLFLHHYLPALYFSILLLCAVFDCLTNNLRPIYRAQAAGVILLFAFVAFLRYASLAYGLAWTKSRCETAKLVKTWDFDCSVLHNEYSQYGLKHADGVDSLDELIFGGELAATTSVGADLAPVQNPFAQKEPEAVVTTADEVIEAVSDDTTPTNEASETTIDVVQVAPKMGEVETDIEN